MALDKDAILRALTSQPQRLQEAVRGRGAPISEFDVLYDSSLKAVGLEVASMDLNLCVEQ